MKFQFSSRKVNFCPIFRFRYKFKVLINFLDSVVVNSKQSVPRDFHWNPSSEQEFKKKKSMSRSLFHLESSGINFNQIGLRNEMQKFNKNDKKDVKREEML
jgi:hypothetical protein